jgi:trimethylamine--corrinoid protein Co-methyltransferase
MTYDRQPALTETDLNQIHQASMAILDRHGLVFHHDGALEVFKKNGFKVSGQRVMMTESQVLKALESTPERFLLTARNQERSRWIGGDDYVLTPTYGPPFVIEADGRQRPGTLADYERAFKLNHTSPVADVTGFKYVAPADIPAPTAYLDMLRMSLTMSDQPLMGSTDDERASENTMELMALIAGSQEKLRERHLALGLINPLSPLAYSEDMAGAILIYARHRQPLNILNMILAGSSGPIRLPGLLALMNAEIMGGLVLAQLVGPGTPIIYGTTSCPIYMKTGAAVVGNPETLQISAATLALARFYQLPCRTGGSLTDALAPDGQAMAEGALSVLNSLRGGVHFVLHALGMIGGYIGLSFEKWIMDEEVWQYALTTLKPMEINPETLDVDGIVTVGSGGSYLTRPETMKLCRKAFLTPQVFNKYDEAGWRKTGGQDILVRCRAELARRDEAYQKPAIDPSLEKDIEALIRRQKEERGRK